MSINIITTDDLRHMKGREGIIFQGCGGDLQEWLDGINDMLTEDGILRNGSRFQECQAFKNGQLTCLLFPFENVNLDVGKLAMWRLKTHESLGGTWLSDYVPNQLGGFIYSQPEKTDQDTGQDAGMDIRIYQINSERDADHLKFMDFAYLAKKGLDAVDSSIYDEVFSGNIACGNLEEIFTKFNTEGHPLYRGHSLSVSDVVLTEKGAFFCDKVGFKEIAFDETLTHKPDNLLKIVYVEPNRPPFISEVGNDLKPLQRAVGGHIEPIYMGDGTILVGNDESKLMGMEGNRRIGDSIIAGPFFIVGEDGEDFRSLTDDEAQRYMSVEISGEINRYIESIIQNNRENLAVTMLASSVYIAENQHYLDYGAAQDAIDMLFKGEKPDTQFRSDYTMERRLDESSFLAYLSDAEGYVQIEANKYLSAHQERFLLQFQKNDALDKAFQELMNDATHPAHKMKAITDAVSRSGAKMVNVTVYKDGQTLTFKTAAKSLRGFKNYYNTYDIPAQDRREFERMFGGYADYNAGDITKITYGRNTIYEAAPRQEESMADDMGMGGMSM